MVVVTMCCIEIFGYSKIIDFVVWVSKEILIVSQVR